MEKLRYLIYIGPGKPENRNITHLYPGQDILLKTSGEGNTLIIYYNLSSE